MRLEYFEMIDRVAVFDRAARHLEARATAQAASPIYAHYFPGRPIRPGVLLTGTKAQASGYLVLGLMNFSHMPSLMAVDKARFRTFVGPGAELAIEAELEHEGYGYAVTKARIAVEGKLICDAGLRFKTMPF